MPIKYLFPINHTQWAMTSKTLTPVRYAYLSRVLSHKNIPLKFIEVLVKLIASKKISCED